MSSKQLFFSLIVVLLLWMARACCGPAPLDDTGLYPAGAIRYMHDSNQGERHLSSYDWLVKRYAKRRGIDWRLVSAIIWHESRYDPGAYSSMGAMGLMQVMKVTAENYGMNAENMLDPDANIDVGTHLFSDLLRQFRREGMDSEEAMRFALGAYNIGIGAMESRREETAEAKRDPDKWEDVALTLDSYNPAIAGYVEAVMHTYRRYCTLVP